MKKHVICLAAVLVAIFATSFISEKKQHVNTTMSAYHWYNFNGDLQDMCDPSYYSLDSDNFPDCPTTQGYVYCEIYAAGDQWNFGEPDLGSIIAYRVRPIQ
jgi:hypothetical protein